SPRIDLGDFASVRSEQNLPVFLLSSILLLHVRAVNFELIDANLIIRRYRAGCGWNEKTSVDVTGAWVVRCRYTAIQSCAEFSRSRIRAYFGDYACTSGQATN